ncbi:MAG: NifB/NifX family molybdenum-iron cluster-binding protein [Candidatus Bathyarchaeia archaeon]|jgi:predicted Fe-Mo cluster-binding NifX family protein|nr:dinitrogenase iron-molybdenum cofactor biosynthesis protein [Thermoproteota archaeon]
MKICLTSQGDNLNALIDPKFGRCEYLIIAETETSQVEVIPNMAAGTRGGAGIKAAQTIADKGVKVLITGNFGPNSFKTLSAANIEIMICTSGTVQEALEKYKKGELKKATTPTIGENFSEGKGNGHGIWAIS